MVWPVVKSHYDREQQSLFNELRKQSPVNLLLDGQFDSPGYCAQLCAVTAIESSSGYVVACVNKHKSVSGTVAIENRQENIFHHF